MFSLRQWWRQAQVPVLGVDLGADAVRVIGLSGRAPGWPPRVSHYGYRALPRGAMRDGAIAMPDEVAVALCDAIRASGSRLRDVALALPAGAAIKKTLPLPAMLNEDDLEYQVEVEAGETLPFQRNEIAIDFAVTGPSAEASDCVDVVLVAARRERIDERVALAQSAGLRPLIVDIESHALMSAISLAEAAREAQPASVVAALWLEPERSHCLFMTGGVLLYERELGLAAAGDVISAERICQEFDRALQLFQTATAHGEPQRIYLLGAMPAALPAALQQRTGMPVEQPDPLQQWSRALGSAAIAEGDLPSSSLLACGLAMRSFD